MSRLWLIARNEYRNAVSKRSFLLGTLAVPTVIVVLLAVTFFVTSRAREGDVDLPLGYVDQSGAIQAEQVRPAGSNSIAIERYESAIDAGEALGAGRIQAYYVLAPDYLTSGSAELFYQQEAPASRVRNAFRSFLRANLLSDLPADVAQRIDSGAALTLRSPDGRREMEPNSVVDAVMPFIAAMLFVFTVLMSSGYLLQAVATEKENRTIEIMATSMSPLQLVGGKVLGLFGVVMTQLAVWLATLVAGVAVGARFWTELQGFGIPWDLIGVILLFFIPAYALVAGMMTALGISVTEVQEAQQVSGMLNMLFMLPMFFVPLLYSHPDSPLMVGLTLFPTTSFLAVALRWGMTSIPVWQLVTSWVLLLGSAVLCVYGASRIFRVGMLRYGKQLSFAEMIAAVTRRPQTARDGGVS